MFASHCHEVCTGLYKKRALIYVTNDVQRETLYTRMIFGPLKKGGIQGLTYMVQALIHYLCYLISFLQIFPRAKQNLKTRLKWKEYHACLHHR